MMLNKVNLYRSYENILKGEASNIIMKENPIFKLRPKFKTRVFRKG